MSFTLPKLSWPVWLRNKNGDNFYEVVSAENWTGEMSNLEMAQNHPILTPAILFVAKLFSQATFTVENMNTGNKRNNHYMLSLLRKPNQYQTREDFLETLMFVMIAQGVAIVYMKRIIGFNEPKSMFVLNKDLITWPDDFNESKFRSNSPNILKKEIIYDKNGENIKIKIKDLKFFYDLPNMLDKNPFKVKSRIDGLRQTLINTKDSLIAKNIILKSNGKELITGEKEGFPLTPEDKSDIENLFNNKLGLSFSRKRGVVTKSKLTHKSLHIALRDLGLDESVKVDGNIIYTALHIPKDILSLEAKKTTYNNFKESMVSYIQNELQPSLNSATAVFNKDLDNNYELIGSYEHMPIMQFILIEKYTVIKTQAEALRSLLSVGVPKAVALEMCGFDKNMKLEEVTNTNQDEATKQNEEDKMWGSRIKVA